MEWVASLFVGLFVGAGVAWYVTRGALNAVRLDVLVEVARVGQLAQRAQDEAAHALRLGQSALYLATAAARPPIRSRPEHGLPTVEGKVLTVAGAAVEAAPPSNDAPSSRRSAAETAAALADVEAERVRPRGHLHALPPPADPLVLRYEELKAKARAAGQRVDHCRRGECFLRECQCNCNGCTRADELLRMAEDDVDHGPDSGPGAA